jgi:hypothetical protein
MSRNNERVLSDQMIEDIKFKMNYDLRYNAYSLFTLIDNMMDAYLTDEWGGFGEVISDVIEDYENNIITELNTQLIEDSFNQNEDNV